MSARPEDPRPALARATGRLARLGLGPGDRLATVTGQDLDGFALGWACALAGVVQVPVPGDLPDPAVRDVLLDARPAMLLVDRPGRSAAAVARDLGLPVPAGLVGAPRDPGADAPRTRAMAYTSGTTGRRKGVHVGVHGPDWGHAVLDDEASTFEHRHGDLHLVVSPLYHSGPFRHALVTAHRGGRVAVLPGFDADALLSALRDLRPTSMFVVPTHLHRLVRAGLGADDLASLTLLVHAGAPCPEPLTRRLLELAPERAVWEFYGSTEGQFSVRPPDVARTAPGSVGRARPGRTLTVRDDDGDPLPAGEVGVVWSTAPRHARFRYWRDPDRTDRAWDGDAFTVGDLGRLDEDGLLTLLGRRGDLVISGGVNVYPAEVERELLQLPGVGEAVAFGVPDDEWGERLVAAVVPTGPVSGVDLLARLRDRLPPARVPRRVLVVDALPRTPTGKVRRTALPDLAD